MQRPLGTTFLVLAVLVAGAAPALGRAAKRLEIEMRVIAPLADPALVPGIARCTSDGVCTVEEDAGLRPGTPLELLP